MRLASLAATISAAALLVAAYPVEVEAQDRARTRITVQPRSYLDPGTVVKPGTARYHNYAFPAQSRFARYGPGSPFGPSFQGDHPSGDGRWPLLGPFEGY